MVKFAAFGKKILPTFTAAAGSHKCWPKLKYGRGNMRIFKHTDKIINVIMNFQLFPDFDSETAFVITRQIYGYSY